eukprot:1187194-Prorocentrum_minimum.AAC.2
MADSRCCLPFSLSPDLVSLLAEPTLTCHRLARRAVADDQGAGEGPAGSKGEQQEQGEVLSGRGGGAEGSDPKGERAVSLPHKKVEYTNRRSACAVYPPVPAPIGSRPGYILPSLLRLGVLIGAYMPRTSRRAAQQSHASHSPECRVCPLTANTRFTLG